MRIFRDPFRPWLQIALLSKPLSLAASKDANLSACPVPPPAIGWEPPQLRLPGPVQASSRHGALSALQAACARASRPLSKDLLPNI